MAYALVISLKQTLEPHLDPSRSRLQIPESEIREIYDELCYLKSFFDKMNSLKDSNSVEDLEKEIKDVLQSIRDLIECHLSDLLLLHSVSDVSSAELAEKVAEAKARLGSLIILLKAKEDFLTGRSQQSPAPPDAAQAVPISSKLWSDKIVGLEDEVMEVKQRIFRGESRRLVICITGIAGIGKTVLAAKVYLDPEIIAHFKFHLLVRIGLEYDPKEVFRSLLSQLASDEYMNEENGEELASQLFKHLFGRRYLIVLDDVRDIRAWDRFQNYFPDNNNGSAIMLTTRMTEVARRACSKENIHLKHLLKPSYAELPHHLEACFLYLGVFPPNYAIPTSQLFKLWAAEGFLNVIRDENESLEKKAEDYLEDLISRSLVTVYEQSSKGGIKRCIVPLPFHYLCMHEAQEDKLFHVVKMGNGNVAQGRIEEQRRLGVHNNVLLGLKQVRGSMRSTTAVRSLLCVGSQHQRRPLQLYLELKRLRVLHALSIRLWEFPNAVARLFGLKYLAITSNGELPPSISRLWNLETLIISRSQIEGSSLVHSTVGDTEAAQAKAPVLYGVRPARST